MRIERSNLVEVVSRVTIEKAQQYVESKNKSLFMLFIFSSVEYYFANRPTDRRTGAREFHPMTENLIQTLNFSAHNFYLALKIRVSGKKV